MALAPRFSGQRLALSTSPRKDCHIVEIYLDYVCPFSAKMFKTLYSVVFPKSSEYSYTDRVQFIFRQQIQPWHPSSTLCHEAAVAVLNLSPGDYWEFSDKLFDLQKEFFDVNVVQESRNETYRRLVKIASDLGVDEGQMLDMLYVPDQPGPDGSLNVGTKVTNDMKVIVKTARLTGVHVTPTVLFNGVVENSISSSFTADQWHEWLTYEYDITRRMATTLFVPTSIHNILSEPTLYWADTFHYCVMSQNTTIPMVTIDLLAYQKSHFRSDSLDFHTGVRALSDTTLHASSGLGSYADGPKSSLTTEQVAMFRHSEIVELLRVGSANNKPISD